jgi:NTP pyrophosphatase (non-canonical NTP hydrolase)
MTNFHPTLALDDLQTEFHSYAKSKGFWGHDDGAHQVDGEKIALMHSELSEALDALRDGNMEEVEIELADCVIRILDYCEARNLRLSRGFNKVRAKMRSRPHLHGRQW